MIRPKKSLGQNFLRDENILRKIADSLDLRNNETVVEIGCGNGALTRHLVGRPKNLIGVEVDSRAISLLKDSVGDRMTLIHADVLDVNLEELSGREKSKLRIVGNIPYYLTSEILFWLFDAGEFLIDSTLMMQLEVARRLVAKPGKKDYGILSVFTRFYTECEMIFKVSRNCFFPKPDVDSAVVRLRFNECLPDCDERQFRSIVRATFGKRRKTLRNGLKSIGIGDETLDSIDFDLKKRPEELSTEDFILLTNLLKITK